PPPMLVAMAGRPSLTDRDRDTREALAKGIAEFNSWRFYDCHETLEDVWREVGSKGEEGTLADFYQGIIKIAAGFHRVLRDNYKGAVSLLSDGSRLLGPYRSVNIGVRGVQLLLDVRCCFDRIMEVGPHDSRV